MFVVRGEKVTTLEKVFEMKFDYTNEKHGELLQFFGSLDPRYTSPITVSVHPTLEDHAVLCLFQPSNAGLVHSLKNTEKVFDQTCQSYE
jgi:hypothetical protein